MHTYDYGDEKLPDDSIAPRDYRALTRSLSVLPETGRAKGAEGLYLVVSDSGREYLVDAREGACQCKDHEFRGARCLHQRRVAFATGARAIPEAIDRDDVDEQLGIHVDGEPRFAGAAVADGGQVVAADGIDPDRLGSYDVPRIGTDDTGAVHFYDTETDRVIVVGEGEGPPEHVEDLDGRPPREWIEFVATKRGWRTRGTEEWLAQVRDLVD